MPRSAPDALVRAVLTACLALAACGPDTAEGTQRPLRVEGRAGIVTVEGTERYTDGAWRKHGPFVFRDDRGEVIAEGHYREGLETGAWKERYEDGSIGRGAYVEGSRQGEWQTFHPDGSLQDKGTYDRGLRTGEWVSYRSDRTLLRVATYREGRMNGPVTVYGPDGRTPVFEESGVYEDGERVAPPPR